MRAIWFKAAVVLFVVFALMTAVAAEGVANVAVTSAVQLNGKKIVAGDYKVSWTGKDNDVQVTFKSGRKELLTAPAKLVERPAAATYSGVVYDTTGKLMEIHFAGKKQVLVFSE